MVRQLVPGSKPKLDAKQWYLAQQGGTLRRYPFDIIMKTPADVGQPRLEGLVVSCRASAPCGHAARPGDDAILILLNADIFLRNCNAAAH